MSRLAEALDELSLEAQARGLTPQAWWMGVRHHDAAIADEALSDRIVSKQGRVVTLAGLPVRVLLESPDRLALWCDEGALDASLP